MLMEMRASEFCMRWWACACVRALLGFVFAGMCACMCVIAWGLIMCGCLFVCARSMVDRNKYLMCCHEMYMFMSTRVDLDKVFKFYLVPLLFH